MKFLIMLLLIILTISEVKAQQEDASDSEELNIIELELNRATPKQKQAPEEAQTVQDQKMIDFSGLGQLAPFSEVSIIQKRFMPKTNRIQFYGGLTTITNDPFFNTIGFAGKMSYFLSETWGLELNYYSLSTSEAKSTTELKNVQGVKTDSLLYPKSFTALDLVYVPIYGKMTWFNEKIVPFDLYFSLGGGTTSLQTGQGVSTIHLAAGQIFSISKSTAFRWDFSWNFFNSKGIDQQDSSYNNLFLTVGASFFYPEAKYR